MSQITNDLICQYCGRSGEDLPFPVFPVNGEEFGTVCADCEHRGAETKTEAVVIPLKARCPECRRVFDLRNEDDAEEWSAGHDCEEP